jgi:hypothetical protein
MMRFSLLRSSLNMHRARHTRLFGVTITHSGSSTSNSRAPHISPLLEAEAALDLLRKQSTADNSVQFIDASW